MISHAVMEKIELGLSLGWSKRQTALYAGISADMLASLLARKAIGPFSHIQSNRGIVTKQWSKMNDHQSRLSQNSAGLTVDLRRDYLFFLYVAQMKQCFYTDKPLLFNQKLHDAISVDRVDQSQGYIEGNVVLTTSRMNTVKLDASLKEVELWMPKWFDRIQEQLPLLNGKVESIYSKYQEALTSTYSHVRAMQCEAIDYMDTNTNTVLFEFHGEK